MNIFVLLNVLCLQAIICIFVIYFVYCSILLHKYQQKEYFVKRRPISLYIHHCSILVWIVYVNQGGYNIFYLSSVSDKTAYQIHFGLDIVGHVAALGFASTTYLCRIWILYFDMQLSRSLQNKSWQMAIDPNIESNNWFLNPKNQRNYGRSGKRLFLYGFIIDIFVIAIYVLARTVMFVTFGIKYPYYLYGIFILYCFAKVGLGIKIWQKFDQFKKFDNFGIYYELKKILQIFLVYILGQCIVVPIHWHFYPFAQFAVGIPALIFGTVMLYYMIPHVIKYNENTKENENSDDGIAHHVHVTRLNIMTNSNIKNDYSINTNTNTNARTPEMSPIPLVASSRSSSINIDKSKFQYKHWSKAVSCPYIYEKFMNHLETEFSIENLLFITEYVQIKHQLKQKYCQLEQMMKDNGLIKFDIKLPPLNDETEREEEMHGQSVEDDEKQEKQEKQKRVSPQWLQAEKIIENLPQMHLSTPSFSASVGPVVPPIVPAEVPPVVPISLIAKRLSQDSNIILAFKSLYNKYIDANGAPFMINISSNCRQELMILLDCNYYYQNTHKTKKTTIDKSVLMSENRSFIDDEWTKQGNSIDWLLLQLLLKSDSAAREISALMQQSFLRFRK